MAGTWFRIMLVPQPTTDREGNMKVARRILIGQVVKPSRVPWWFQEDFDRWAQSGGGRLLEWNEFSDEDWLEELYSRNRPILVFRPTYPIQLPKFAFATDAMVEQVQKAMTDNPQTAHQIVTETFLRSIGVVFQSDIQSEDQYKSLSNSGFVPVNIADGTPECLMPWLQPQTYMDFSPAVEPDDPNMRIGARQITSWTPWKTGQDWDGLMDQIWGRSLVKEARATPSILKTE